MEYKIEFRCDGENLELIPEEIVARTGLKFPAAHQNSKDIALLAKELKAYKKDTICRVPFCVTVEAEALGGNIKLGDEKFGPRVESYAFDTMEKLKSITAMDFTKGRIKEVLDAVEQLSKECETVALTVEGPFTILASLIDPLVFYKEIRKNKQVVEEAMNIIEQNIYGYMMEGIKRGAKIISYGDPVGSLDIVGPKVYKEISGKTTHSILKRISAYEGNTLIHLCGKTTTACEQLGLCRTVPIEVAEDMTYGEAILKLLENQNHVSFIGHACIKKTPFRLKKPFIWGIELIEQSIQA